MKIELFNDNFQNYKSYHIPTKAQLVIADIPYNLGRNAYASNKNWYIDGKITKDPSAKAGKTFFNTDEHFKHEYKEQIRLYVQAIERLTSIKISEKYLYLLNAGRLIKL